VRYATGVRPKWRLNAAGARRQNVERDVTVQARPDFAQQLQDLALGWHLQEKNRRAGQASLMFLAIGAAPASLRKEVR
jgi:hypothetical protein